VIELLIIIGLIILNGLFALAELAVVSARHARLKALVAAGHPGARSALALASDPSRLLSTVQIGITLIGIVTGVFSGVTFGDQLVRKLEQYGLTTGVADAIGFGSIVAVITYLSVIIGELVPKNLALRNPEVIACAVAPLMTMLSKLAAPAVWLLDASTKLVLRILGQAPKIPARVTEEEIKALIAEAESAGVLETGERQMISGVMRLADRSVSGVMTPRPDVDWIDATAAEDELISRLITTTHSRLPVGDGTIDAMIGVVQARELLTALLANKPLDIKAQTRKAPIIPETVDALDALSVLREAEVPMALIHDEYGHFEGLVTPADILEAIAGVFRADVAQHDIYAVERKDGTWLLSGAMPADEMADRLGIVLPERRDYQTVAGLVLSGLRHLPTTGESAELFGWRFEVVDMDGRRIDKVLASRAIAARRAPNMTRGGQRDP
jgi:putative hemolysin